METLALNPSCENYRLESVELKLPRWPFRLETIALLVFVWERSPWTRRMISAIWAFSLGKACLKPPHWDLRLRSPRLGTSI